MVNMTPSTYLIVKGPVDDSSIVEESIAGVVFVICLLILVDNNGWKSAIWRV